MNNFLDILAKAQDLSRFQEKVDWLKKQAPKGIAWGRLCELVIEFEKSKEH